MSAQPRRGAGGVRPGRRRTGAARGRGHESRPRAAPGVVCAVITVSDTRRGAADRSGAALARLLERSGHRVAIRAWVRDQPDQIRRAARAALARRDLDAVFLTGGTGMAPRDRTPEAVGPLVERWLPGFGELFRLLSRAQVGPAAWFSRAAAGVARGRLVVLLPGSTRAVELGLRRLVLPELVHAMRTLGRVQPEE